jgi:pilus assembly protein CpaF
VLEIELHVPERAPLRRSLEYGVYVIGRGLSVDLRLPHPSVAKRHAELAITEQKISLKDLSSEQGVQRAGHNISEYGPLRTGDEFRLGECGLKVLSSLYDGAGSALESKSASPRVITEALAGGVHPLMEADDLRALKERLQQLVVHELDLFRRTALGNLSQANLRQEARQAIESLIGSGAVELPAHIDRAQFTMEMTAEIIGYGPLEPFLADESVSEIMVNGPNRIFVERAGRLSPVTARFVNSDSLVRVIERIVAPLGRRIDEGVPMVDARLPDGSRVNAIIPPLSLIGPIVTIRKFSKQRFTMQRLVDIGSLTQGMADFLAACVQYRKNIVVSGGTGSGKTTFLNALSQYIPEYERILTIEDAAELKLGQPHVVSLEARPANVEGKGEVTIRDLVRNALRMRPDRIIVGECRGGEALDMLQAMNTGHDGSLTTGHANSPRDLLSRLEVMVLMAGMDLPVRAIREQIASAVDIIVQQTRFSDGRRRVTSIVEVDGMESEKILTQELFAFKQHGIAPSGEVQGRYQGRGIAPRFYEELTESGVTLDRSVFAI